MVQWFKRLYLRLSRQNVILFSHWKKKNVSLLNSSQTVKSEMKQHQIPTRSQHLSCLVLQRFKKVVDQMEQNVSGYTCRRKTVRWPLNVLCNIFDVAAFNAFLLKRWTTYIWSGVSSWKNFAISTYLQKHTRGRHARNIRLWKAPPCCLVFAKNIMGIFTKTVVEFNILLSLTKARDQSAKNAMLLFVHRIAP